MKKTTSSSTHAHTLTRIAAALEKIAATTSPPAVNLDDAACWRWESANGGRLLALPEVAAADLSLLCGLEEQIDLLDKNTRAFMRGRPANHALLTGPRGTGKSSVARGVFARYTGAGLRVIETDSAGLAELPFLLAQLSGRRERYMIYCDDLSFAHDAGTPLFQRLKSALESGLAGAERVRVCATSNRRHLAAEYASDNLARFNEEVDGAETLEETLSLSDRFGLWLPFIDATEEEYLRMVRQWLENFNVSPTASRLRSARRWADERGARNGRLARHFAIAAANKTI